MDTNNFFVHLRIFHEAEENEIDDSADTLTNEAEFDRRLNLEYSDFDEVGLIAASDEEFARWCVSVNKGLAPPSQNSGDLLLEEITPTPAPSLSSKEETTSGGNLGDDATPGSDSPTVPGGLE